MNAVAHNHFRFHLGAAAITMLRSGGFRAPLRELMVAPEAQLTPALIALLETPQPFPCWSIHIALGDISLLVDPGRYNIPPGDPWSLPPDDIPPDLAWQLAETGIPPASITHVVITHPHDDHYDGAVHPQHHRPRAHVPERAPLPEPRRLERPRLSPIPR